MIVQPALDVKIMGGYAGLLTGMTGKTHQMFDDVAIMRTPPDIVVLAPADETEARQAIRAIAGVTSPAYMKASPWRASRYGAGAPAARGSGRRTTSPRTRRPG
jgi:transketolase C-terminal domain/subunit